MEDNSYLKHFINEDIYVLAGDVEMPSTAEEPTQPKIVSNPSVEKATPPPAEESKPVEKEPETTPIYTPPIYSGLFAKKVLVFVHTKGLKFDHMDLLFKILEAIQLGKDDVAILPTGHIETKEDYEWLISLETKQTFAFGLTPQWMNRLHSDHEKYANHQSKMGNLMFVDALPDLAAQVELKKKLWGELKKLSV